MKKSSLFICILLVFLLLLGSLFACTGDTRKISFAKAEYHLYLKGGDISVTPEVLITPKGNDYTLSVSNPTIVKVEGKTITALSDGVVTLTATSGPSSCSVEVYVHLELNAETDYTQTSDGKLAVYFISEVFSFAVQRIESGKTATQPESPIREGYTLQGWYTDSEFTTPYDFTTPVTKSITLYALWTTAEPDYKFIVRDGLTYVNGFKYPSIPYEEAVLPLTDKDGSEVKGIATGAFAELTNLKNVSVPESYTVIESLAFENCTNLEKVVIDGSSLTAIETGAFNGCSNLLNVEFKNSGITSIGASAFENCSKLTGINLPDTVQSIGSKAFKHCESLSAITLPASLKIIEMETFAYTAIETIDIKNIESIYNQAFWGATKLSTIQNPEKLKTVASYCFGSLLTTPYSNEATAWLKQSYEISRYGDKTGSSVNYLGNILVYVSPVGIGTKPLPTYVKASTASIAGEAFADLSNATAWFIGRTPPTYGTNAFGSSTSASGVTKPTVDVVVPSGCTEIYAKAWLPNQTPKDEEGYFVPSQYWLALVQKIYESTSYPNTVIDLTLYKRNPLVNHSGSDSAPVYYNQILAKNADDAYAGIAFNTSSVYYVINAYTGKDTSIDLNALMLNDCADSGATPTLEKICPYAFASNVTLTELKLPERIIYINGFAFVECLSLKALYIIGDGSYKPLSYTVTQTSFNGTMLPSDFRIYVPLAELDYYRIYWGGYCPGIDGKIEALP